MYQVIDINSQQWNNVKKISSKRSRMRKPDFISITSDKAEPKIIQID